MKNIVDNVTNHIKRRLRQYLDKGSSTAIDKKEDSIQEAKEGIKDIPQNVIDINVKDSTQWIKKIFFISRKYTISQVLFRDTLHAMLRAQELFHVYVDDKQKLMDASEVIASTTTSMQTCQEQFRDLAKSGNALDGLSKDASIVVDLLGRVLRRLNYLAGAKGQ